MQSVQQSKMGLQKSIFSIFYLTTRIIQYLTTTNVFFEFGLFSIVNWLVVDLEQFVGLALFSFNSLHTHKKKEPNAGLT